MQTSRREHFKPADFRASCDEAIASGASRGRKVRLS
jgi:hypothetical protein